MKPEARVEPDAKRTKLAEPKKEPKIEPHDPADEAPRLDREPKDRDDKTAALEAEKRRRREKEERREKRRKEKSSKHEGMISRGIILFDDVTLNLPGEFRVVLCDIDYVGSTSSPLFPPLPPLPK